MKISYLKQLKHPGQGMVEYAGALLVAAAIVVMLIASVPGTWVNLYNFAAANVFAQLGI